MVSAGQCMHKQALGEFKPALIPHHPHIKEKIKFYLATCQRPEFWLNDKDNSWNYVT